MLETMRALDEKRMVVIATSLAKPQFTEYEKLALEYRLRDDIAFIKADIKWNTQNYQNPAPDFVVVYKEDGDAKDRSPPMPY